MYQYAYPRHRYVEWVAEIEHHFMALFATKLANITLAHKCGAIKGVNFRLPII